MRIGIRTLTPLWTGDIDRDGRAAKTTGVLGSLRWWYEGVLRGRGIFACDPTVDGRCLFKAKAFGTALRAEGASRYAIADVFEAGLGDGVCAACRLFGCTGWARRFAATLEGGVAIDLHFLVNRAVSKPQAKWLFEIFGGEERQGQRRTVGRDVSYTFGVRAVWGDLSLVVEPASRGYAGAPCDGVIAYLLDLIERRGGLGAKTQNGFGQIRLIDKPAEWSALLDAGRRFVDGLSPASDPSRARVPVSKAFDLGSFFSRTYVVANREPYRGSLVEIGKRPALPDANAFLPFAFDIRYKSQSAFRGAGTNVGLRPELRQTLGANAEQELLGRTKGKDRSASRIHVSHLYREASANRYKLRVWGHVPPGVIASDRKAVTPEAVARIVDGYVLRILPGTTIEPVEGEGPGR